MNKQKIQNLMNSARKDKNLRALVAYRTVLSEIQAKEASDNADLSDDQIFKVIENEAKLYDETADAFGDRPEADGYREQSSLLNSLLPDFLIDDEYDKFVSECIESSDASSMKDMGNVMSEAKKLGQVQNIRVDMKKISNMVRNRLTQ